MTRVLLENPLFDLGTVFSFISFLKNVIHNLLKCIYNIPPKQLLKTSDA